MDYIIKGGTVCLEGEHFQADITLRDGKIWSLGCIGHKGSEEVIHADGMYVCPGGIDRTPIWTCSSRRSIARVTIFTAAVWQLPAAGRRPSSTTWPLVRKAALCDIPLSNTRNWLKTLSR